MMAFDRTPSEREAALLPELISRCIQEYYAI
jgi:hypothetical protein